MSQNTAQWFLHKLSHLTGGSDELPVFTPTTSGMVPKAGGDRNLFLRADGTWANPRTSGSSGRNTTPSGLELPTPHSHTHITGGTDLIPSFTSITSGLVPYTSGVGNTYFLRADGTWAVPAGGGGSTTFVGLTDTPANYTGSANYMVMVGAGAPPTALVFTDPTGYNLTNFNDNLSGNKYMDHSSISIVANLGVGSIVGGGDLTNNRTLTLTGDVISPGNHYYYGTNAVGTKSWYIPTLLLLSDTPVNFAGAGGFMVMVNATPDAIEFIDPSGYAINNFSGTLTANWTITGDDSYIWRVESSHTGTGSVYAEFSDSGKSFSVASWSADNYTGAYGAFYVDDAAINLFLEVAGPTSPKGIYIDSDMTIRDDPDVTGFVYNADYSAAGTLLDRWIPDWAAVIAQLGGNDLHSTITTPGAPYDGYLVYWDDGNSRYDLTAPGGGGMVYPSAGIALSTGSAWSSSITDNSASWNTAYGWGDHAGLYANISHHHWGTATNKYIVLGSASGEVESESDFYLETTGSNTALHINATGGRSTLWLEDNSVAYAQLDTYVSTGARLQTIGSLYLYSTHATNPRVILGSINGAAALVTISSTTSTDSITLSVSDTSAATTFRVDEDGDLYAPQLAAKGAETNVVYFNTGTGKLTYGTVSTTPAGGSDTHVQFNNSGAFGGSGDFIWDGTTVTVSGYVFADRYYVDSAPANTVGNGITAFVDVDINTIGIGNAFYYSASGTSYRSADASSASMMPVSALALNATIGDPRQVLLVGFLNDSSYSFTAGEIVYASTTLGQLTTDISGYGSGDMVQAVGIAITSTSLYFNPDFAMVEIV